MKNLDAKKNCFETGQLRGSFWVKFEHKKSNWVKQFAEKSKLKINQLGKSDKIVKSVSSKSNKTPMN